MESQPDGRTTSHENGSAQSVDVENGDDSSGTIQPRKGMSPYATGGGGVTFERKVAAHYLAKLVAGDGATEFGEGRLVESVAFQQSATHSTDDLVVRTFREEETTPSLEIALAVRRSPNIVRSDQRTQELIANFIRDLINPSTEGFERGLGLVVSGYRPHAEQLAILADLAANQKDTSGFFDLVRTPNAFDLSVRQRLVHVENLVERALEDINATDPTNAAVQQWTWQLLFKLHVLMPRFESPDDTDWVTMTHRLMPVARGSDLDGAMRLRDRLIALVSEYSPKSARVDLKLLRRDAFDVLDSDVRRNRNGWNVLDNLHQAALTSVRNEVVDAEGARVVSLERKKTETELAKIARTARGLVVSGESGVGKSSLTLRTLTSKCTPSSDGRQALCINLRHVPKLTVDFQRILGRSLSTLLDELSAPFRVLIVDGADAVAEGSEEVFGYLIDSALESSVAVVAVASVESKGIVREILVDRIGDGLSDLEVEPLTDPELEEIVATFLELEPLFANPRSREIMRRLVVVDLLVRAGRIGNPVTESEALQQVWSGLVRRGEKSDRGYPDAREIALLRLADLALGNGERLDVLNSLDPAAVAGLRRDGLLQSPVAGPLSIGPEFAHDEVRRYAVARLLMAGGDPATKLSDSQAPRWALGAANLTCQTLLQLPDSVDNPLVGRFEELQASFDALVAEGFGPRWSDVPSEALVAMADPSAVLKDAWPLLLDGDAAGLRRLTRVIKQRVRGDSGLVRLAAIEPVIERLLEEEAPWKLGEFATDLLREWLHSHAVSQSPAGDVLRIALRERLVAASDEGERRLARHMEKARATRSSDEDARERLFAERYPFLVVDREIHDRRRRRTELVPRECRDEDFVELLALLGPEIESRCEKILGRIAENAPDCLAPAVEEPLTGWSLANSRPGLLGEMTEAYYLDLEPDITALNEDGIRGHEVRSGSLYLPLAGPDRGPFMALFLSDFRGGAAVINRLLNHAARTRERIRENRHGAADSAEGTAIDANKVVLDIDGSRRPYLGDDQVWRWYRGTGIGPYPCMSALLALERVADQLISAGGSIENVVSALLEECENLAMIGLAVGLIARHLEVSGKVPDAFLAEPMVWEYEFARVVSEDSVLAYQSPDVKRSDRRKWSLRELSVALALGASDERAADLRVAGKRLVENAVRMGDSWRSAERTEDGPAVDQWLARVHGWASSLDRDNLRVSEGPDGLLIQQTPPAEVIQELQPSENDLWRGAETIRLTVRYFPGPNEPFTYPEDPDEIYRDAVSARELLNSPSTFNARDPWDVPAVVAAATLDAHLLRHICVPEDALAWAVDTAVRVSEGEPPPSSFETEETYFERGAYRSAARALPLLLLPRARQLRAAIDGRATRLHHSRIKAGLMNLSRAVPHEVRLHLARGLEHLWTSPCARDDGCHHQVGWRIATEMARFCTLGEWDHVKGRYAPARLEDPLVEAIGNTASESILPNRLDASIRALAPAAIANICVSETARILLSTLLHAQRRSLIHYNEQGRDVDPRGDHTLVGARALLTLASDGDDEELYAHVEAYADEADLIAKLLHALSSVAAETEDLAATARRIWPGMMVRVLNINAAGRDMSPVKRLEDAAHAALIPNPAPGTANLYRELAGKPIAWWRPLAMRPAVEKWLVEAAGSATCVDRLITFLGVLSRDDQARVGLPWVADLVLANPSRVAKRSWHVTRWLKETRSHVVNAHHGDMWQNVVDALVVAGNTQLAPYSV